MAYLYDLHHTEQLQPRHMYFNECSIMILRNYWRIKLAINFLNISN